MIVGMIKPNDGNVFLMTWNHRKAPMYQRARMGIGYLPQEASIFRRMTAKENIIAVLADDGHSHAVEKRADETDAEDFGLAHISRSKGYMLSGGERRRTEIARRSGH